MPHRSQPRHHRRLVSLVLTLCLAAGGLAVHGAPSAAAAPARAAERTAPGENGPLAFVVNSDIWYRSAEGAFHRVTSGRLSPRWDLEMSPDGRRIAFSIASTPGLWVVNLNGTGLRNVLAGYREVSGNSGYGPSWSPDGQRLVFTAFSMKTDNHELFTVAVDEGSSLERLTEFGVGSEAGPVWNPVPGSTEVAFVPCCSGRIRAIDVDTRAERWVSAPSDPPAWNLDWSPDGERLAVEAYSDGRLYTVARDGTDWVYLDPAYSRSLTRPSWSPDGTRIAAESLDSSRTTAIVTVDAEQGVPAGVTALTEDWGSVELAPAWGPECVAQCTGTELTARKKTRTSKVKVTGTLNPPVAVRVRVELVRLAGGRWRTVAAKKARVRDSGRYATTFPRPRKGRCGVLVEFRGTATHMPSWAAIPPFRC